MPSADEPNKHPQAPTVAQSLDELPMAAELFDRQDPRSLVNLLPKPLADLFESAAVNKKFLYLTEREAERRLKPDSVVYKIRIAFWKVFEYARSTHTGISMRKIAELSGHPEHYVRSIIMHRPDAFTFILIPPTSYENELDEALMFGMRRLREDILTLPLTRTKFNSDTQMEEEVPIPENAKILLQAIAFLDMRKHGGIVQKQLTVHNDISKDTTRQAKQSMAELDQKIKELEEKAHKVALGQLDTRYLEGVTSVPMAKSAVGTIDTGIVLENGTVIESVEAAGKLMQDIIINKVSK